MNTASNNGKLQRLVCRSLFPQRKEVFYVDKITKCYKHQTGGIWKVQMCLLFVDVRQASGRLRKKTEKKLWKSHFSLPIKKFSSVQFFNKRKAAFLRLKVWKDFTAVYNVRCMATIFKTKSDLSTCHVTMPKACEHNWFIYGWTRLLGEEGTGLFTFRLRSRFEIDKLTVLKLTSLRTKRSKSTGS